VKPNRSLDPTRDGMPLQAAAGRHFILGLPRPAVAVGSARTLKLHFLRLL